MFKEMHLCEENSGQWRLEVIDASDRVGVALFTGPNAREMSLLLYRCLQLVQDEDLTS